MVRFKKLTFFKVSLKIYLLRQKEIKLKIFFKTTQLASINKFYITRLFFLFIFFNSCIDPVVPQFDFIEDLVIVDAIASSVPGTTFVSVKKTFLEFGKYKAVFVTGCKVKLINSVTKEEVPLYEESGNYLVSADFSVQEGSQWELEVLTPSGKTYKSLSEKVPSAVSIENISGAYNKEMAFDEASGKFIPGHEIRIDFQEPSEKDNFYYFQYRAYEKELYCALCNNGVLRFGECVSQIDNPLAKEYYTYLCDQTCWKITYNQEISLFDDAFTNGKSISNLLVGRLPLNTRQDVLVEVLQLNITEEAHKYYKTLKDIVDNNSGFNAPLPSALIGNFYNPNDAEDPVLGRFTAAAATTKSVFIKRGTISQAPVSSFRVPQPELLGDPLPNPITYESPCIEKRNQTKVKPLLWEE